MDDGPTPSLLRWKILLSLCVCNKNTVDVFITLKRTTCILEKRDRSVNRDVTRHVASRIKSVSFKPLSLKLLCDLFGNGKNTVAEYIVLEHAAVYLKRKVLRADQSSNWWIGSAMRRIKTYCSRTYDNHGTDRAL